MSQIDQTAVIGHPPEQRGYDGPGWAPMIADTARIEAFVTVDAGTERATVVGAGVWLMKHVHVGHDAVIASKSELAPGTVVGGWAVLGERVKVGINATILPFRKIGAGAVIGAGSVVTRDVPAGETWAGNPARKLEDHERDPRVHSERSSVRRLDVEYPDHFKPGSLAA